VLEIALFYASTALGNVEVNFGKLIVGAFIPAVVWAAVFIAGMVAFKGMESPFGPENRVIVLGAALAGLLVSWAVPALAFVPVLPVSIPRGMLVSVFQLLLRVFLYVLIAAVVMVVLAVLQILRTAPEKRSPQAAAPAIVKSA
jgi:hypothetical protein